VAGYFLRGGQKLMPGKTNNSPFSAAKREAVMRRVSMLLTAVVVTAGCSKTETPAADTAAAAAAAAPAPAPAPAAVVAVTEPEIAGTWTGTSMPMGSDSVVAKWKQVCGAGTCKGTTEGSKVTITASYTLAGDSAVGSSQPYTDPANKALKGAKVMDTWIAHFKGDSASGTGATHLASKPDSILMAFHFTGTKQH